MSQQTAVTSVESLDLTRYRGLWYEIGRLPLKWEAAEASDITAEYTPDNDGSVRVDNRCIDEDGKPSQSIGRATLVNGEAGRLEVSFLPEFLRWIPFTRGDYWVLKIDDAYTVALVGTPDQKNLWLLAREPRIDPATAAAYLAEATRQGFDLGKWITPKQSGRRVTDDQLGG
ncbi:lipocalin family protein [Mycolicibacterium psychrotolerans]|uniref:Membrane protein n=1 Tax=Mycolicibacterium psychrotolerans TaxID=216929 RepID=A0A7I7M9H1_9MYCO|nr:lipocalin family protein [Mycolicibacterium psychrotolerans]BBX68835.1 membrane protein [Mycolicibacterium psychrotolerans]